MGPSFDLTKNYCMQVILLNVFVHLSIIKAKLLSLGKCGIVSFLKIIIGECFFCHKNEGELSSQLASAVGVKLIELFGLLSYILHVVKDYVKEMTS